MKMKTGEDSAANNPVYTAIYYRALAQGRVRIQFHHLQLEIIFSKQL